MQGRDFLAVASRLCRSNSEADRRTSVSRAYFAVFNQIKAELGKRDIAIEKTANGHDQLYRYLNNCGVAAGQRIASTLSSLRTIRDEADYDLETPTFIEKTCVLQFELAEASLVRFSGINNDELVAGIRSYMIRSREPR
jgi:uncharacterized protein (UPF0332 family)